MPTVAAANRVEVEVVVEGKGGCGVWALDLRERRRRLLLGRYLDCSESASGIRPAERRGHQYHDVALELRCIKDQRGGEDTQVIRQWVRGWREKGGI